MQGEAKPAKVFRCDVSPKMQFDTAPTHAKAKPQKKPPTVF